nr:MAG TPA: hypothetical protein [Caudoviricetes sp.]
MLVTTKKKIYLCEYGVVEEGTEVDVSDEIIEQFGEEVFDGIVKEDVEPVEKPKRGKKTEE